MNQDIFEVMDTGDPLVIAAAAVMMGGTFKFKGNKRTSNQEEENTRITKARILQQNKIAGASAERVAAQQLESQGYKIVGSQVSIRTSAGNRRVDHLVEDTNGNLIAIEVKSGNAIRSSTQLKKDALIQNDGGVVIGKNAGDYLNQTVKIPTIEWKIK
jgi:Holliday junction resolvase-like predicted endonuclease